MNVVPGELGLWGNKVMCDATYTTFVYISMHDAQGNMVMSLCVLLRLEICRVATGYVEKRFTTTIIT